MIYFVQPGGGASGEVRITPAAAGGEVRTGSVCGCHRNSGGNGAVCSGGHDGEAGVGVDQAGDEWLVSGERWQRARGLGEAVGAVGAHVVELLLGREHTVVQREGAMVVAPLTSCHGGGGLAQAVVDAVGVAQFRQRRLIRKGDLGIAVHALLLDTVLV